MEAVELRKNEIAVAVVLGAWALMLRVCARVGSSAAACPGRRRGQCCDRLIGAVVLLQEVLVQALESKGGGASQVEGSWRSLPGSQTF